jgi:hypothetical protein
MTSYNPHDLQRTFKISPGRIIKNYYNVFTGRAMVWLHEAVAGVYFVLVMIDDLDRLDPPPVCWLCRVPERVRRNRGQWHRLHAASQRPPNFKGWSR